MPPGPETPLPDSGDRRDLVAVVIPARRASTRLPDKLLLAETGRPLIAHTVERVLAAQAASSGRIARVLVAVDDPALADAARDAGAEAVMTSPECASGTDRVAEAVRAMGKAAPEIIVNVQGDEPEIAPETVLAAARVLDGTGAPMGTLAAPITDKAEIHNPAIVNVVLAAAGDALYFSRAPIPFDRDDHAPAERRALKHLGIYAYRRAFLLGYADLPVSSLESIEKLEQLRALEAGHRIRVAIVEHAPVGIDTPEDYAAFVTRTKNLATKH